MDTLNRILPQLARGVLKTMDLMPNEIPKDYHPAVHFGEYASPDFGSTVEPL